jgi:MFS family permease
MAPKRAESRIAFSHSNVIPLRDSFCVRQSFCWVPPTTVSSVGHLRERDSAGRDRESRPGTRTPQSGEVVETEIPARLDRLPWSRWHWLVLIGLGTVWILDGLEVTIVGAVGSTLTSAHSGISITTGEVGDAAGVYVAGACFGALLFGHLTDRLGRKRLFLVTLGLYLCATLLTATSKDAWMFFAFRFLTGMGIGGEYAAINSAIDELIPARVRGTVDLIVNGSYWLGTAAGAAATLVLLDPKILAVDLGWRVCFFMGAVLGLGILLVRRNLPESPRWLLTHGHPDEAEKVVEEIERDIRSSTGQELEEPEESIRVEQRPTLGFIQVSRIVFGQYPRRSVLGLSLFVGQAFLYNAVFFTYALVLSTFYNVSSGSVGYYLIAFAVGNFLGPLVLGRLFDVVGRRVMISSTYLLSGIMLIVTARLFDAGILSATTQTVAWMVIFFFASAGASSAYLTVSEIFPMETRALAIAFFYAVGTGLGGIIGPVLFGNLIATKHPFDVAIGYVIGGALMIFSGIVEVAMGVDAEQRRLEQVASPVSAIDAGGDAPEPAKRKTDPHQPPRGRNGRAAWSPIPQASAYPAHNPYLQREVDLIVEDLRRTGSLPSIEIARRVGARYWGPGRFKGAMRAALASGRIRRVGWNRFAAAPGQTTSTSLEQLGPSRRADQVPGQSSRNSGSGE